VEFAVNFRRRSDSGNRLLACSDDNYVSYVSTAFLVASEVS